MDARSTARRDRQVIRILGIVRALTQGERLTLRQLQARFSASRETIYRDVKAIQAIGYPVVGDEAGRLFPLRLDPGFRGSAPTVPLTRQEVAALMWAVKQVGTHQPFRAALSTAVPKLNALVGGREARFASALDGAIGGWERGVKDYSASLPIILRLVEAIVSRRQCRVTHQNPWRDRPQVFPYNPYRLVTVHGGLYALGWGPEHRRPITLLVSRIQAIDIGAETFSVHPSYDAKRYEAEAFGIVWEKPMTVVVRFSADQAPFVREREWHPTQKLRDLRDGRVELTFRAGDVTTFEEEIIKLFYVRCPLKVGITYALLEKDRGAPRTAVRQGGIADTAVRVASALDEHTREDPATTYLYLLGSEDTQYRLTWHALTFTAGSGPTSARWRTIE